MGELRSRRGAKPARETSKPPAEVHKESSLSTSFQRFFRGWDLRFESDAEEAEFKRFLEPDLLKNGMVGTFMNTYCWTVCVFQTASQENLNLSSLLSLSAGRVRLFSILLYLSGALCAFVVGVVALARRRLGWFRGLQYEVLFGLGSLYSMAICIIGNKWHIALWFGEHPDNVWVVDRRGEEALILMAISAILMGYALYVPARTCVLWMLPVVSGFMYIMVAVIVGPTFPGYAPQNITLVVVIGSMTLQGAHHNERHVRKDWLMAQEQKQTIQEQEVQIHQGTTIAGCMEAVCESLCDIVIKLKKDLYMVRSSQTAKSFFGSDLSTHCFTDMLCESDVSRFRDLLVRVDAGTLPQCLPVTLILYSKQVSASLLAVSTGVPEPSYLVSIRCEQDDISEVNNIELDLGPPACASEMPSCAPSEDTRSCHRLDEFPSFFNKVVGMDENEADAASALTLKTAPASVAGNNGGRLCSFKPAVGLGMGNYTIVRVAGKGSQGTVFEVTNDNGQRFALKRISLLGQLWQRDFPTHLANWDREVRLLKSMEWASEVVVHIQEGWVQTDFKIACIVMEWLPHTLTQVLSKRDKLQAEAVPPSDICVWLAQMALGIAAIHSVGWMHRDIKTDNMLLTADEKHCKVADMGTGRPLSARRDQDVASDAGSIQTSYTAKQGTLLYMSPEVYEDGGYYGKPADIFGLGCILLEMMVGQKQFLAASQDTATGMSNQVAAAMLERIKLDRCLGDADINANQNLETLCLRMLADHAEARPAAEMIVASQFLSEFAAEVVQRSPSLSKLCRPIAQ